MSKLFNVYVVDIDSGVKKIIAENKTERNAEAIREMAVMRRGVEHEYFTIEPKDES